MQITRFCGFSSTGSYPEPSFAQSGSFEGSSDFCSAAEPGR
jgi:hypothetical protein